MGETLYGQRRAQQSWVVCPVDSWVDAGGAERGMEGAPGPWPVCAASVCTHTTCEQGAGTGLELE